MQQPTNTTNATETSPRTYAQVATGDQQVMSLEAKVSGVPLRLSGKRSRVEHGSTETDPRWSQKEDAFSQAGHDEEQVPRRLGKNGRAPTLEGFVPEGTVGTADANGRAAQEPRYRSTRQADGPRPKEDSPRCLPGSQDSAGAGRGLRQSQPERLEQEKEMQREGLQTRQVERAATAGLDLNQEPFVRERENLEESLKTMTMELAAAETPEMQDVL